MVGPQPPPGADESELRLWLDEVNETMKFHPAHGLSMSCGTVTMDLKRALVLVIWNSRLKLYQLPKGRRNVDESMFAAALRETYEETGLHVTPLKLDVTTRATLPSTEQSGKAKTNPDVTEGHPSNEFVGACLYPDPQSKTAAFKMVFFFVATADSTTTPDSGTQEEWEDLNVKWIPLSEVASTLRFGVEVETVQKAVADLRKSGYAIAA